MRVPIKTACMILDINPHSLDHLPYTVISKNRDGVSQKDLYKFIDDRDDAIKFLCMVQGCLMFLLDSATNLGITKHKIAQDMGFKGLPNLARFLQAEAYSEHTATVFVKMNMKYKGIVNKYDKYMGYRKENK